MKTKEVTNLTGKSTSAKKKPSVLKNKADRLYQELGRLKFRDCLVCGKPMSCLHHYFPKSTSTPLRYDIDNGIPLCAGCHFSLHNSNPTIQNKINEAKGDEWLKDLTRKRYTLQVKPNVEWYMAHIEQLEQMIKLQKEYEQLSNTLDW